MNHFLYLRDDLIDEYGVLKLQDKILEIMVYIDSFCKKHNIDYYLMGGSALGAMRHKGFIPWDDDLDIFMDYDNYHKFMNCCNKFLDTKRFYFQQEDTAELPYFFSKIRMNGTTCIEATTKNLKNVHKGIFVDIMCLNHAAPSKIGKKIQYYAAGLLKAKAISKRFYQTNSKKKKIQLFIAKNIVIGPVKPFLIYLVRRYNKKSSAEFAHLFGRAKFKNSFYPIDIFQSQRYVPFEKVNLAVPYKVEKYLTIRYGSDYMKMPDEATKAIYSSHAMEWNTEKDYKDYEHQ